MKSNNLDKSSEQLNKWFASTENKEACLQTLIAMQLRATIMEVVFWARNKEKIGEDLFEYYNPYQEAYSLVSKLRLFGFMEESKSNEPK